MPIKAEFASAIPNAYFDQELVSLTKEKFKNDLIKLLNQCTDTIGIDLTSISNFVSTLDCTKRFSPAFYLSIQTLKEAISSKILTAILDAIQRIAWLQIYGPYEDTLKVTSVLSEYWEVPYVEKMRRYEQEDICGNTTIVRPIFESDLSFHKENINEALNLLETSSIGIFQEIQTFVTSIKIFQGRVLRGQASGDAFGAIWIRIPPKEDDQVGYWVEHIVHEVSHLKLHTLFYHEKFVLNPIEEKVFRAPIRDDLRPMLGIYHASFVLSRMVRVFRKLSFSGYPARFRDRLQLCELQFEKGLETVFSDKAKFTENGNLIRDSLKSCAYDLEK